MIALLGVMQQSLATYAILIRGQDHHAAVALDSLLARARQHRNRLLRRAADTLMETDALRFLDIAAVVSDLEKMGEDLSVSAHLLVPLVTPN
jgi:hypothetical protein